jgi:ribA/ribD-fused uncharacterized protein
VDGGVIVDDMRFPTVEHGFQAAKTTSSTERRKIQQQPTPGKAKRMGKTVTLRADWDDMREGVMLDLLRQKFSRSPLREELLNTGSEELVEENRWHDTYWGRCSCLKHSGVGLNRLGILLMQVRDEVHRGDEFWPGSC